MARCPDDLVFLNIGSSIIAKLDDNGTHPDTAMYTYDIDRNVLTLLPRATPTDVERDALYDTIVADPRVPERAMVILDLRQMHVPSDLADVERRARKMVAGLGRKLGSVCAVIVPPEMTLEAQHLQSMSHQLGTRIALFHDDTAARTWLGQFG